MRLPHITSLYGRIFAIFWFTMFLILVAVLTLPHLDPRKTRNIPPDIYRDLLAKRDHLQQRFANNDDLSAVLFALERFRGQDDHHPLRFFITDDNGNILTTRQHQDFSLRALKNFTTGLEDPTQAKQRLYGRYMIAGPVPITLANQKLRLYFGTRWDRPPPFLLRLFDRPLQLLLTVMLISTPLLLWLAWALSQPARRLQLAAQRVAKGEFVVDPTLETGTLEFRQAGASFNQMVEAVNQMISGQQLLLSNISHELRSPLTRLRMASALATRKQGNSPELERIDTEAQRLEQMISELLELSRMQANSHLVREVQLLQSLWEEILCDAEFEAGQRGKKLEFTPIPDRRITGNPQLLMSALDNIVRNAIRYAKQQVVLDIHIMQDTLSVSVDDDGDGVPDSELEAIFRPFYRVSSARDRDSGGTGLGLAITESAIRQHSGTICAKRSQLGGLRVEFTLPISTE